MCVCMGGGHAGLMCGCQRGGEGEDGRAVMARKEGEGQRWWPGVIKERVSDHASNICVSGPAEVESPAGTSGGRTL